MPGIMKAKDLIKYLKKHPEYDIVVLCDDGYITTTIHTWWSSFFRKKIFLNCDINADLFDSIRQYDYELKTGHK
jgi:hypothetical protein